MSKINDDFKKMLTDENRKLNGKPNAELNEPSGEHKSAKNLGNGRWKYQGKTYKEESIGKS